MTVNPHETDINGLSSGKLCPDLMAGLFGFVVDKVTLEEAFPRVIPLSPVSIHPSTLLIQISSIYHRRYTINESVTQLKIEQTSA
jgi:hypothetical protein